MDRDDVCARPGRAPLLLDGQRVLPRPRRRGLDREFVALTLALVALALGVTLLAAWAGLGGAW